VIQLVLCGDLGTVGSPRIPITDDGRKRSAEVLDRYWKVSKVFPICEDE